MAKEKQVFFCQECGFESTKWMGQCPGCKAWNSFCEEKVTVGAKSQSGRRAVVAPTSILEVETTDETRFTTGIGELNRVLGGGIVSGSLVLVGGDPGIGKSTILLQMCRNMSEMGQKILYVSGEESLSQIKMRAERIGNFTKDMLLLCVNNLEDVEEYVKKDTPKVIVIDSIQTIVTDDVESAPGSVSQVKEVTARLMRMAKQTGIAIFIVGHVTKEGTVAGPRTLEHMVDTVLYFEGERNAGFRVLRAVKNRFGSTNEIGVFEMKGTGLAEVKNPSQLMLDGRPDDTSGSVVVCTMEGTRPILLEIQALVCQSSFNLPRRTSVGLDYNRVNLLLAVLEKRGGIVMAGCDAYVNIAGGMRLDDPSADLGIVFALVSSFKNRAIPSDMVMFGEMGLSGEVRGVSGAEQRVREAAKMGFKTCIIPRSNLDNVKKMNIKTPSSKTQIQSLSGGNMQKVLIGRWLANNPDVLILDEPTRGIDVGAKSEIYKLMTQLAYEGKSIIMISSELPELLRMSDRVIVMCEGRKTGELDIAEATQEKIMTLATKREVG